MKPCTPIRYIPCSECGTDFGQTELDARRYVIRCPACRRVHKKANTAMSSKLKGTRKSTLETVLPKERKAHFDKDKNEWFMKVRVRKKNSKEDFQWDKVFLGIGADASPELVDQTFATTYARMEMAGASRFSAEHLAKKQKRRKSKRDDATSWKQGYARDLGVTMHRITVTVYKVYLPDPLEDGKKIYVGRFNSRGEARKARNAKYQEICRQVVPCAVCGMLPLHRAHGRLTHFSSKCPNRVQMPTGLKPLMQTKIWNFAFSEGEIKDLGKLTQADLGRMGYLHISRGGKRWYARTDVEMRISLAANYAKEPEPEIFFE